ncbi:MAG: protein kinase domain-containing protein [Myxococcaceae bacterium]
MEHCGDCGRTYLVEVSADETGRRRQGSQPAAKLALAPELLPEPATAVVQVPGQTTGNLPSDSIPRSDQTFVDDDDTPPPGQHPTRRMAPSRARPPVRVEVKRRRPPSHSVPREGPQAEVKPGMTLGGYKLVARIGAGGMGTVWLARQLSLDRNVAVKILRPTLGEDPTFVVQFTHEAFAAAQLVHHNIAQIYDTGTEGSLHYFSMEYVEGESLSALLRREGKLDSEVAAGYVLQAARGLKFAHDRQMIHRDIKPENLLLNRDGIVKVADLGLVKRTDEEEAALKQPLQKHDGKHPSASDSVDQKAAVGTPAFMAPEQSMDSATIDARADIYSLGCTLYNLVAGRPPFEGESAAVVMSKHFFEEPVPPETYARRVPAELSAIILKMMAKKPEDRFQRIDEAIDVLEDFLGLDGSAVFSPREEHAVLLERSVQEFTQASWSRRRGYAALAFLFGVLALTGTAAYLGLRGLAAATAGFGLTVWLSSSFVNAIAQRAAVLLKLRHLVLGAKLWIWLTGLLVVGIGVGLLFWFGLLRNVTGVAALAVATTLLFYLVVDRRAARQRRPPLEAVEKMLKAMRLKGLEEMALRQFVCKYAGHDWEPFYEALFGYEAKLLARARWGRDEKNLPRKRRGVWRDPLVKWMDRRLEARQRAKDQRQLDRLEQDPGASA